MIQLNVSSKQHTEFISITGEIQNVIDRENWHTGILALFIPHTTAAVTIQENADPDVICDLAYALDKAVPWQDARYQHSEGNTAAHVKASMLGTSAQCFIEKKRLLLGRWQGIFFCEFDGPRERKVWLTFQKS